jgi:hypothetical protein
MSVRKLTWETSVRVAPLAQSDAQRDQTGAHRLVDELYRSTDGRLRQMEPPQPIRSSRLANI